MASVTFKKGLLANLSGVAISEGQFLVTTDERAIYLDYDGSHRIRLGDFIEVANIAALPTASTASTTALYYAAEENVLAKSNGSTWVQINPDSTYTMEIPTTGENAGKLVLKKTVGGTTTIASVVTLPDSGVTEVVEGTDNGTIKVTKNGTTTSVAVHGLGTAAYKAETDFDEAGAADTAEQNAKDYTDTQIAGLDSSVAATAAVGNVYSVLTGVTETDGKLTAKTEVTLSAVAKTGAAADVSVADASSKFTGETVEAVLTELQGNIETTASEAVVTVEKQSTAETGYAATYVVKQNNTQVGAKINIPQDWLLKYAWCRAVEKYDSTKTYYGGELVIDPSATGASTVYAAKISETGVTGKTWAEFSTSTYSIASTESAAEGTRFLAFYMNIKEGTEESSLVLINVSDLVDVYTAGNGITIDASNVISAKVKAENGLSVDATDGIKLGLASASANGAMSSSDFTKLSGIEAGAEVNTIDAVDTNDFAIGTNRTLQVATGKQMMTSAQATKLEGIETGAEVNVLEGVQVNGTDLTIDANKKVNLVTNSAYNASTNKLATMSDVQAAALEWGTF